MSDWPVEYRCAPGLTAQHGEYRIRPIHWDDREPIRRWRNEQIDVLRQAEPLSAEDQDQYFLEVVRAQFDEPAPSQVLFSLDERDVLIGYGGLVHIDWTRKVAELSFLDSTNRSHGDSFFADWKAFLGLIKDFAGALNLERLTTMTPHRRVALIRLLEGHGFEPQGHPTNAAAPLLDGCLHHELRLAGSCTGEVS